jgi:hypothetical protein
MTSTHVAQGSPGWIAARLGMVTASRMIAVTKRLKNGAWSAERADYMAELLAERLTCRPSDHFVSREMLWGTEQEPFARAAYEFEHDSVVEPAGFIVHPRITESGASPDGFVGDDGVLELKCPTSATHLETLMGGPIEDTYVKQMQWQMACTDRAFCDFVSFDPRMSSAMQLHVQRVPRDDAMIEKMERDVEVFLGELNSKIAALRAQFLPPPMAEAPPAAPIAIPTDEIDGIPRFLDRRPLKNRLLADISKLPTARDLLRWSLEMSEAANQLPRAEQDEIAAAILGRQTQLNGAAAAQYALSSQSWPRQSAPARSVIDNRFERLAREASRTTRLMGAFKDR